MAKSKEQIAAELKASVEALASGAAEGVTPEAPKAETPAPAETGEVAQALTGLSTPEAETVTDAAPAKEEPANKSGEVLAFTVLKNGLYHAGRLQAIGAKIKLTEAEYNNVAQYGFVEPA